VEKGLRTYVSKLFTESIKRAIRKATSLNEAAEILCEDEEEHAQDPATYDSIESLVADFSSSMDGNESYTLCIDREHLPTKLCY
jgi:ABC-type transporter Mla maintaining outer membrane lipid asymmetry ATPase subunit MlaF